MGNQRISTIFRVAAYNKRWWQAFGVIASCLPTKSSDDETESNPVVPAGWLTSKPTWWNSFWGFHLVGFFVFGDAFSGNQGYELT